MTSSPDPLDRWDIPRLDEDPISLAAACTPEGAWAPPELAGARPVNGAARAAAWSPRQEVAEAFEAGRAAGREEGSVQAQQRVSRALEVLERIAESLHAARQDLLRRSERDLECLALAVARKLVQREVAADPAVLHELVSRALELMPLETPLEIRMHPDDLAALGDDPRRAIAVEHGATLQWIADPELEAGGFLLESPQRIVDGRPDVALRNLYERFDQE
jgi:flagellar biosynthesis/type III secretory pathway protein FliH